jgi:hypothetical protein
MLRQVLPLFAGACVVVALACGGGERSAPPEKQDFWYLDLARGLEVAAETGRPLLAVFR